MGKNSFFAATYAFEQLCGFLDALCQFKFEHNSSRIA